MPRNVVSALPVLLAAMVSSCSGLDRTSRDTTQPTYDRFTGRLTQLTYDANRDGRVDTWIDMDGARPLGARIDGNQDGRVDRWELYDATGRLIRVGMSQADDGRADAWAYPTVDGHLERFETSRTADERRITRREIYDSRAPVPETVLLRVEEDSDGDRRFDFWQTYDAGALKTASWDLNADGAADLRFTYSGSAPVLLERAPDASGRFTQRTELK